jgi:FdhD protein
VSGPFREVGIARVDPSGSTRATDRAAVEEPLEIRVHGDPFAVVMRTPGLDLELAAGFLFSERVIRGPEELGLLRHCGDPDHSFENVIDATLVHVDLGERLGERRRVLTNASCGLCGRVTIASLKVEAPPIEARWTVAPGVVSSLPERLRAVQAGFDVTGGLHAAGLFDGQASLVDLAEDVGRHNAVDKVIGRGLLGRAPPSDGLILFVSGRASYEIVQKAFLAGLPIVAAVSAPSSLAIELAQEVGITLLGFVRGDTFNVYSHPERVA